MSEPVLEQRHDAAAVLTLNHPKTRNALSGDMLFRLAECLERLNEDDSCKAIVLRGANGQFCSGGDISNMTTERPLPVGRGRMTLSHRVVSAMVKGNKPVIAAVEGYAAGAGFSLACAADYVIATPDAKFVSSFAKVGLLPDLGLLWSLPRRIGLAQARRIFYSAAVTETEDALRLGIVDEQVASSDLLLARALELAVQFTTHAPLSVRLVRSALARGMDTLDQALAYEMDNQAALYLTDDHKEAVNAFMNKRKPEFHGR